MRLRRIAGVLACAATCLLAGCFQSSTLVKLNPDGSGTLEQTISMTAQAMEQIKAFSAMGDKNKKGGAADASQDPFSVDQAKAAAAKMGSGVSFVSAEKIDTADRKGLKAVYAFKDIRTLSLNEVNSPAGADMGDKSDKPMALSFSQLPNGHSLLTIKNDTATTTAKPAAAGADKSSPDKSSPLKGMDDAQAMDMIKAMFAGMKVDLAVQVGHLVKTNVPYVAGGTVTLLSMDFDQVLANPGALEKLQKANSLAETKVALQGVKGIKVTLDPTMTIEFTK
jgi:hypothetical protein